MPIRQLLADIFNYDFSACRDGAEFSKRFFGRAPVLSDLPAVFRVVSQEQVEIGGKAIPAAIRIKGKKSGAPFIIMAQLHGNEPAGLAGILLAMALAEAGKLENDVIGVVGNPLAAGQYFAALAANPKARQETRDCFRCGLDESGALLPDGNRIPVDFLKQSPALAHIRRAQELYALAQHGSGLLDIHSARGSMLCVTDHKRDADLRHSPIRAVLTGLADAISAHASGAATVQTFKTLVAGFPNLKCHIGIEAGKHEAPDSPRHAASFTLSLLHTLGLTSVKPLQKKEDGVFERYAVKPRLAYSDLAHKKLAAGDRVYMAKECLLEHEIPNRSGQVIVRAKDGTYQVQSVLQFIVTPAGKLAYAVYQYDEMEAVKKGSVVAVAVPSGAEFKAPHDFSGIFFSKSRTLYDKDPAVGPWPVAAEDIAKIKFCYPCEVGKLLIDFK